MFTDQEKKTLQSTIKALKFIGFAMVGGVVMVGVMFYIVIDIANVEREANQLLTILAIALPAGLIALAYFLPGLLFRNLNARTKLAVILQNYRTAKIISLAFLEAAALIPMILGFVNGRVSPEYFISLVPFWLLYKSIPNEDKFNSFYQTIRKRFA